MTGEHRAHSLAPLNIGHAEYNRIGHGGVGSEDITDTTWINILPARDDHGVPSTVDHHPPFVIEVSAVRGQQASVGCNWAFDPEIAILHKHPMAREW